MPGAVAGDAAGKDLASFGDEEPERLDILVINEFKLLCTESTELSPLKSSLLQCTPEVSL